MSNKWPTAPGRNDAKGKEERRRFLVATDGERTEVGYFEWLKKKAVDIIYPKYIKGNLLKVIKRASEIRNKGNYDLAFVVCDKDQHKETELNAAIKISKGLGVILCISNESFEIWLLAHLDKKVDSKASNRKEAQRMAKTARLVKGDDGKIINESRFSIDMVNKALVEAERLRKTYGSNILESSPTTDVDKVVSRIKLE
ncbi:RloB domain-containing protein [Candidatus Saccharibacteria bacterium]|nr:RloB domain-containing protein [Candidatus Saccharibacteria bacterium]